MPTVLKGLPIAWSWQGRGQAVGLYLDEQEVWCGWESGDVAAFDHEGKLLRRWRLPAAVLSLVSDEAWRYAGCRDGKIYDLTGKTPRVAYEVEQHAEVQAIDVHSGNLAACDGRGACTVMDAEQELLWRQAPKHGNSGWMVRADASGVYAGTSDGVARYTWKGKRVWRTKTPWVGYGWVGSGRVYAIVDCFSRSVAVVALDQAKGKLEATGSCWSTERYFRPANNAAACAASADGKRIFGASCEALLGFDARGKRLWESPTRCGAACSMALHGDRLFVATHTGALACLDVSEAAVRAARSKPGRKVKGKRLSSIPVTARKLQRAAQAGKGVVLECVSEGGRLRVKVVSPGYHSDWHCQFPRDIRQAGARYVVDEVREAAQGGFYRALGEIRRLGK